MKDNIELGYDDDLRLDMEDDSNENCSEWEWDKIHRCYTILEEELEDWNNFFSPANQEEEGNLFRKVDESECGHLLVATILQYGKFDKDFFLIRLPNWVFIYGSDKVKKNPPEQFEITGEIMRVEGGYGTQFATYNSKTREFAYTKYKIRDSSMFNAVCGKGKVPITADGMLDWEKHIPM